MPSVISGSTACPIRNLLFTWQRTPTTERRHGGKQPLAKSTAAEAAAISSETPYVSGVDARSKHERSASKHNAYPPTHLWSGLVWSNPVSSYCWCRTEGNVHPYRPLLCHKTSHGWLQHLRMFHSIDRHHSSTQACMPCEVYCTRRRCSPLSTPYPCRQAALRYPHRLARRTLGCRTAGSSCHRRRFRNGPFEVSTRDTAFPPLRMGIWFHDSVPSRSSRRA